METQTARPYQLLNKDSKRFVKTKKSVYNYGLMNGILASDVEK